MSAWQPGGYARPAGWQFGPRVAGMGVRIGAWLVDGLIFGLISLGLLLVASPFGAVTLNADYSRQLQANPGAQPTVPPLAVDHDRLLVAIGVWLVVAVLYPAVCWAVAGGLPGQRALGLRVVDAVGGGNLSPWRALVRSVLLNGLLAAAWVPPFAATVQIMSTQAPGAGGFYDPAQLSGLIDTGSWSLLLTISQLVMSLWPITLLVSTGLSFDHRGLHDSAARSMVVRMAPVQNWQPYPYAAPQMSATPVPPVPGQPAAQAPFGPPPAASGTPPSSSALPGNPAERAPSPPEIWQPAQEPEPVAGRIGGILRVAPVGRRLAAYLMDTALIFLIYSFTASIVVVLASSDPSAEPSEKERMTVALVTGIVQLAYFVATWSAWRGSLGQRILGVMVVREDGSRLSPIDGVARWAALQGPLALSIAVPDSLFILGSIGAAVWTSVLLTTVRLDSQGRGLHDRIAGSRAILGR